MAKMDEAVVSFSAMVEGCAPVVAKGLMGRVRYLPLFGLVAILHAGATLAAPALPILLGELEPEVPLAEMMVAIRESAKVSPRVLQAKAAAAQQQGVHTGLRAGLLPQVEVRVGGQATLSRNLSSESTEQERLLPKERVDAVASAQQLLTDFGATARQMAASGYRLTAADLFTTYTVSEVMSDLAESWVRYIASEAQHRVIQTHFRRVSLILHDTQERQRLGAGSGMDVARAESSLAETRALLSESAAEVAVAGAEVDRLFQRGRPTGAGWPEAPVSVYSSSSAAIRAASASARMQVAELNSRAARREADAVAAARFPQLTAGIQATRYELFTGGRDHDVRATVGIRQELVSSRILGGPLMQAKALADAAGARETEQARMLEAASIAAFARLESAKVAVDARKDGYVAAMQVRNMAVEQHRLARQSLLELLRAEAHALDAARALINATAARDVAAWRLALVTGALDRESEL